MEKVKTTPKDFFLWAGAMIALFGSVSAFIALFFGYIDYAFPQELSYYGDPYSGISYQMAALIVLAPVFLGLMRAIRRDIANDHSRGEVWVRRWALFLTVFVAGAVIVIDLITLLTTFLSGEEITVRFLLKVAIVLLVAAAGFMHFLADIWGYWNKNPRYARSILWAVAILVVASIACGFVLFGTPHSQRQLRMDEQRINDLSSIQWELVNYWQQKGSLPESLSLLNDPLRGYTTPTDPSTGAQYGYKRYGPLDFAVCATFERESFKTSNDMPSRAYGTLAGSWVHVAGDACFDRSIDPERYPPVPKPAQ